MAGTHYVFLSIFGLLVLRQITCKTTCTINLNQYSPQEEPLFLNPEGTEILYPTDRANLEITGGLKLRVYCGSRNFKIVNTHTEDSLLVQCISGNAFKILDSTQQYRQVFSYFPSDNFPSGNFPSGHFPSGDEQAASFPFGGSEHALGGKTAGVQARTFACRSVVRADIRPGKPCGLNRVDNHHREYSIGFSVGKGFLPLISVCFNTHLKSVLWSKHSVSPSVEHHMSKVPRIRFIQDREPYGTLLNVDRLYNRDQQRETIAHLLHSKSLADKYIVNNGKSLAYFARGHLAPKGDFVYAGEQLATFRLVNVAPQWQYFNGGQWEKIESTLRRYVIQHRVKASILTLTLGITQLEDEQHEDRNIYLYFKETTGEKLIKVPKLYVKIIKFGAEASSRNVVIVGVNQPYESHVKIYPWLEDITHRNDLKHSAGYIYCCTPADFVDYLRSARGHLVDYGSQSRPEGSDYGRSVATNYGRPEGSDYGRSVGTNYGRPEEIDNSRPEDTDYGRPEGVDYGSQSRPEGSDYGRSVGTNYGRPEEIENSRPEDTDYGRPEGVDYGRPEEVDNSTPEDINYGRPHVLESGRPEGTIYGRPEGIDNSKSERTNYGRPEGIDNSRPEGSDYGRPEGIEGDLFDSYGSPMGQPPKRPNNT
ncbi:hypothetical protein M8J76_000655 [Diaphorina citri]|nr:hypothetical protein M8J76_000655 [Diaphorina citri]